MKATDKKAGAVPHLSIAFALLFVALVVVVFPASADKFQMGILVSFSQLPL